MHVTNQQEAAVAQRFERDAAPTGDAADLPVGVLVQRASEQTSQLVKQEIQLAQLELTRKAKTAAIGAGALVVAGVIAFFATGALIATAIIALATAVDTWLAAAIVTGALFLVAAIAGVVGLGRMKKATPPAPEQTIESVQHDVEEIKTRASNHG